MTKPLTIAEAKTLAHAMGVTIKRVTPVDSELAVYFKGEGVDSPAAYFTDDPSDALGTAAVMAESDLENGKASLAPNVVREAIQQARARLGITKREAAPETIRTIDLTPTWAALAPAMIAILESGGEEGKRVIREELARMAALADERNAMAREAATKAPHANANPHGYFSVSETLADNDCDHGPAIGHVVPSLDLVVYTYPDKPDLISFHDMGILPEVKG